MIGADQYAWHKIFFFFVDSNSILKPISITFCLVVGLIVDFDCEHLYYAYLMASIN